MERLIKIPPYYCMLTLSLPQSGISEQSNWSERNVCAALKLCMNFKLRFAPTIFFPSNYVILHYATKFIIIVDMGKINTAGAHVNAQVSCH